MLFPVWAYMLSRVNNYSDKNEVMEKGDKKKNLVGFNLARQNS